VGGIPPPVKERVNLRSSLPVKKSSFRVRIRSALGKNQSSQSSDKNLSCSEIIQKLDLVRFKIVSPTLYFVFSYRTFDSQEKHPVHYNGGKALPCISRTARYKFPYLP